MQLSWDSSLHLPLWVSDTERGAIEDRLETWTDELEAVGADLASIASLKKPLRPLWISQRTVIWLNEVPDHDSWDFTPIILVSGSCSTGPIQQMTSSEFSWNYISGAGDDEESWSRGLTPSLFWGNVYDIISSAPSLCNQRVAEIVETDRVQRSQRGLIAPQIRVKSNKLNSSVDDIPLKVGLESHGEDRCIAWLASTNVAACSTVNGMLTSI